MDDRFLKLPNLCQEIILRELILKNDARNIRRAYEKDTLFQRTFELTWTRTLESLKVSLLPFDQLEMQKSLIKLALESKTAVLSLVYLSFY